MIYNYFDLTGDFDLTPSEAIKAFEAKGLKPTFSYLDMVAEEHEAAFTVAKLMDTDLLATVREKLDQAISEGTTLAQFKRDLIPTLQKAGWWGKKDIIDPQTGALVRAQLGSPSRLENIFRTNLQSAYAMGQWQKIEEQKNTAPFLLYDALDDGRTRPAHAAYDGIVLPVGHPFWDTHTPPNGYNCRCNVIQLSRDELADLGLTVSPEPDMPKRQWTNPRTGKVEVIAGGVDPQFNANPGKIRLAKIEALKAEKAARLTPQEAKALAVASAAIETARQASRQEAISDPLLIQLQREQNDRAFKSEKERARQEKAQQVLDKAVAEDTALAGSIRQVLSRRGSNEMTPVELLRAARRLLRR